MISTALRLAAAVEVLFASPAFAQVEVYAGVEAGAERRQALSDNMEKVADAADDVRAPSDEGFAYGVFAGVETPLSPNLFAGLEVNAGKSETDTTAEVFRGIQLVESVFVGVIDRTRVTPRWNYAVTGRLGFDLSPSVSVYGLAGLGGERVRIGVRSGFELIEGVEQSSNAITFRRSYEGVTFGGGVRLFLSDRIGAQLEYRRLETDDGYDPERLTAGLLYRF